MEKLNETTNALLELVIGMTINEYNIEDYYEMKYNEETKEWYRPYDTKEWNKHFDDLGLNMKYEKLDGELTTDFNKIIDIDKKVKRYIKEIENGEYDNFYVSLSGFQQMLFFEKNNGRLFIVTESRKFNVDYEHVYVIIKHIVEYNEKYKQLELDNVKKDIV